MQIENEAAEVTIGELACLAQEVNTATDATPLTETGALNFSGNV
jgi:hypothetical protein